MFKKIYLIILLGLIVTSCGKKGDPIYNDKDQQSKIISTKITTVL